jgi:hypothetical protein
MSASIQPGETYQFNLARARVVEITVDEVVWIDATAPTKMRRAPYWFFAKYAEHKNGDRT